MTEETITILDRDYSSDGHVFYIIKVGQYNHEEYVKFFNGQPNGCTCKNKVRFNECSHQEALAKVEAGYQSQSPNREGSFPPTI